MLWLRWWREILTRELPLAYPKYEIWHGIDTCASILVASMSDSDTALPTLKNTRMLPTHPHGYHHTNHQSSTLQPPPPPPPRSSSSSSSSTIIINHHHHVFSITHTKYKKKKRSKPTCCAEAVVSNTRKSTDVPDATSDTANHLEIWSLLTWKKIRVLVFLGGCWNWAHMCAMVKSRYIGDGHINPTIGLMTIPYYIYGNNGSLDPGTCIPNVRVRTGLLYKGFQNTGTSRKLHFSTWHLSETPFFYMAMAPRKLIFNIPNIRQSYGSWHGKY